MCCKAPVMTIEKDGKTITLAESGAIIEFIINKYGPQLAPDPADECVRQVVKA
jgi:glutathione S-transferase